MLDVKTRLTISVITEYKIGDNFANLLSCTNQAATMIFKYRRELEELKTSKFDGSHSAFQ